MFDKVLTIIAPHECLNCRKEGSLLCFDCYEGLEKAAARCYRCERSQSDFTTCQKCKPATPLASVLAAVKYEMTAKDLVWRMKFGRARAAAATIAAKLSLPSADAKHRQIVVHVPTATVRVRQRGYDQAKLIARALARREHVPHCTALARVGQQRQVGASILTRKSQLQTAFRCVNVHEVVDAHVVLVDDVVTSGATLEAAAQQLAAAGAWRIDATVFAQA